MAKKNKIFTTDYFQGLKDLYGRGEESKPELVKKKPFSFGRQAFAKEKEARDGKGNRHQQVSIKNARTLRVPTTGGARPVVKAKGDKVHG